MWYQNPYIATICIFLLTAVVFFLMFMLEVCCGIMILGTFWLVEILGWLLGIQSLEGRENPGVASQVLDKGIWPYSGPFYLGNRRRVVEGSRRGDWTS